MRPRTTRPTGSAPVCAAAPLLILLLALQFPLVQFVKTAVDRATTVRDVTGTVHFVSDGSAAQLLQLGLSLASASVAMHLILRSLRGRSFRVTVWSVLALTLLFAEVLRGRAEALALVYAGLTLLVLLAAGVLRIGYQSVACVGLVAAGTALTNLLFSLVNADRGWAPCRADKCTVAGGLLRGYYPQENVLGMFLATLLPAVAFIRGSTLRRISLALVLLGILLTGSRTALAAMLLGGWAYVVVRRRAAPQVRQGDAAKVVTLIPLLSFIASGVMFFTLSDMALTGRGLIFRILREALAEQPLLGPGREALFDAYYSGMANWYLAHEHGQAAYIIGNAGVLGAILMLAALASLVRAGWLSQGPLPAVFALVPALGFLTEPTWEVGVRSAYIVSLVLTVVFASQAHRHEPVPTPPPNERREPTPPRLANVTDFPPLSAISRSLDGPH